MIMEKRDSSRLKAKAEISSKRIKTRDMESLLLSDETKFCNSKNAQVGNNHQFGKEVSQVNCNARKDELLCVHLHPHKNVSTKKVSHNLVSNGDGSHRGMSLDLNTEDVASSISQESHIGCKYQEKLAKDTEPGRPPRSVRERDPLAVWQEMKQNGFLSHQGSFLSRSVAGPSSSHGGIPVPKQRTRKAKGDPLSLKKKLEVDKNQKVDRLMKITPPSGLLNGLNPGIINHVRNKKQVRSIIEAIVRTEKQERRNSDEHKQEDVTGVLNEIDKASNLSRSQLDGEFESNHVCQDDKQILSFPPPNAFDETSSFYTKKSIGIVGVSSLSVSAATVASQWLELLSHDIRGRLLALRRSKRRVRSVITTELPLLISKEILSEQEKDLDNLKNSSAGFNNVAATVHKARWITLFDQMDSALSEEEKQLENWLSQVKETQFHCDTGLQHLHWSSFFGLQGCAISERTDEADCSNKELAVTAAAAAIYSTCNYLMSKDNVPCF